MPDATFLKEVLFALLTLTIAAGIVLLVLL
jgi:hypothetical protein